MRPSEYTAALIQVLQAKAAMVRGAKVLEIGSGSGVVLAALGELGAASLCGIDIEEDAVTSGMLLLAELGHGETAELYVGDMWLPVAGRRFDLIVANLPHFPMERSDVPGRLPSWSAGGTNGRALLDPFLEGLEAHLAADGRAIITHNAFVDLDRSREILAGHGLTLERCAHHAGLHSRRQALAHDRQRARRPGRPHHPPLRPLRLRRDAHRRDRQTGVAGQ